jgi:hypothetical protein
MPSNEPYPDDLWDLWYCDTFDHDSEPSLELDGFGLVIGLSELWARYLFETIQPDGREGFSSFSLNWNQRRIYIQGDKKGALRLRIWMFGDKTQSEKGYVEEADKALLNQIADAHARIVDSDQSTQAILLLASIAIDRTEFEKQLKKLSA